MRLVISIHALVKRATGYSAVHTAIFGISIHALVKRATARHTNVIIYHVISIHALVKRATAPVTVSVSLTVYFNPRPREEGD